MENSEFLFDHHTTSKQDFEDHSQLMSASTTSDAAAASPTIASSGVGGGANNNLLLDGEVETVGSADGTFLVDNDDRYDDDAGVEARNQHQPQAYDEDYGHSEMPPSSMMYDNDGVAEEAEDDDISKHAPAAAVGVTAATATPVVSSSQHSSSIDDFEFIATPQSTSDREVKMDNLLDFEPHQPVAAQPPTSATNNLVETLLTGEDLKPHTDAAAAYLENEFAQFSSGTQQQAAQDFGFPAAAKPVKDVYNDFMEAERGGRVGQMPSSHFEVEQPIETISSTPIIPEPAAPVKYEREEKEEELKVNYQHSDDGDDLLEQFSAPVAMDSKKQLEEEAALIENEMKQTQIEAEKVVVPVPVPAVPLVSDKEEIVVKHQQPKPEEFKEVIKPKVEVDVPKPTPAPVAAAPVPTPAPAPVQKKPQPKKDELITTSAEEMFCKFGVDAWFKPERLHPKVESLIYWRDVKKSGIVCGAGMVILLAMSCFSVISVFAYVSLLALFGTVAFRIYKFVMQAIQKTSEGHPFKAFMDFELQLPQEKVQEVTGVAVSHINSVLAELRRLFLVEDLVDSIKFGLMLWCLTYVGAWFNGMTLVILSYVALFTLPKVYETNKTSIDAYLDLVRSKINEITEKVKAAIPIGKKVESDKEK